MAQGIRLTLYGVIGGILGALLLTRFLSTQLYGVGTTDVLAFVAATTLMLAVAFLAAGFPAWRATRIDPIIALRAE
jgi:ABC-type antimicrobial peptide transport system permease subunit